MIRGIVNGNLIIIQNYVINSNKIDYIQQNKCFIIFLFISIELSRSFK